MITENTLPDDLNFDDAQPAPATPSTTTTPTVPSPTATPSSTPAPAATPQPSSGKSEDESDEPTDYEKDLFKKFHASSYDPSSPVDKEKLENLRQAAEKVGQDDEAKLRAATYELQYKDKPKTKTEPTSKLQSETEADKRKRLLQPVKGMYVRTGFNQFRPAVQADLEAKTPLFMQNPNPVLRSINPYVSVDRTALKAKKATPVDQQAMDREMSAKGYQRLGPGGTRAEKGGRKERKSQYGGAAGSLSNFFGDVGNTLTGR